MFEKIYESLTEPRDIPNDLQVAPGNVLLLRAIGIGVQKYTCPVNPTSPAVPQAILIFNDSIRMGGNHLRRAAI